MSSSTDISSRPRALPYGWTKQIDNKSGQTFYVDTKATPPRSIWTHPYEDEQFLAAHPDVREKLQTDGRPGTQKQRRHSYTGPETSNSVAKPPKRGFLARLKDKAVGTKEEREAQKHQLELTQERRRQERMSAPIGMGSFGQPQYPQQYGGYRQQYGGYGQQGMGPMGMGAMGGGGMMGGSGMMGRRRGMGGGGMALPLVGGLAGGLLLGDMLDGGLNDHDYNDYGGSGDYGGGDFGGGDF